MIKGGVVTGNGTLLVAAAGGEHPVLDTEERKELMTVALEVANGRVPVLSSIQHTDYREIIKLARMAQKLIIPLKRRIDNKRVIEQAAVIAALNHEYLSNEKTGFELAKYLQLRLNAISDISEK